jgi:hypothetical protein
MVCVWNVNVRGELRSGELGTSQSSSIIMSRDTKNSYGVTCPIGARVGPRRVYILCRDGRRFERIYQIKKSDTSNYARVIGPRRA